ncbi:MAG: hypothetical protein M1826_003713 [Phylliscum demangeonii]|nr:MAG: hypothetical protein M1826_003713 [Phylliscum demangeonii]
MLLALLLVWITEGRPRYPSMEAGQKVAYISDIGASGLKPLFIAGSCVTTIFLDLAFLSERWLRHRGRLARNTSMTQKVLVVLSLVFATVGTCGLILLSIFDTLHHPSLHRYIISAIFICAQYQRLGIHNRELRVLRLSFWIKLVFIIVEGLLAIAFAICLYKHYSTAGAILEWTISFIFTFYVLSFLIDLLPAARHRSHHGHGRPRDTEMATAGTGLEADHATHADTGAGLGMGVDGSSTSNASTLRHENNNGYPLPPTTSSSSKQRPPASQNF